MIHVLLSALCVLAGVVTLLPDPFAEFLRDYGMTLLAGLVLVGILAGHLLAEIEKGAQIVRTPGGPSKGGHKAMRGPTL